MRTRELSRYPDEETMVHGNDATKGKVCIT